MVAGTDALPDRLLSRLMVKPPGGAGTFRVIVPVDIRPPVTLAGLSVRLVRNGFTVSVAVLVTDWKLADMMVVAVAFTL